MASEKKPFEPRFSFSPAIARLRRLQAGFKDRGKAAAAMRRNGYPIDCRNIWDAECPSRSNNIQSLLLLAMFDVYRLHRVKDLVLYTPRPIVLVETKLARLAACRKSMRNNERKTLPEA